MKMLATSTGFYKGARIREGATFEFDENAMVAARKDGKPVLDAKGAPVMVKVAAPKWAVPVGTPVAAKPKAAGDLKPLEAQAAVKQKTAAAQDGMA